MRVQITTVADRTPWNGTGVVLGDESGTGSLWIDHAHHGEVDVTADDLARGYMEIDE